MAANALDASDLAVGSAFGALALSPPPCVAGASSMRALWAQLALRHWRPQGFDFSRSLKKSPRLITGHSPSIALCFAARNAFGAAVVVIKSDGVGNLKVAVDCAIEAGCIAGMAKLRRWGLPARDLAACAQLTAWSPWWIPGD